MRKKAFTLPGILLLGSVLQGCSFDLKTQIDIQAPPSVVWSHLINFDAYPKWNPFVKQISGKLEKGARLKITVQACASEPMDFKPRLLIVETDRELRWLGRLWVPGIFDGAHRFRIQPLPGGASRLIHTESLSGILVPFLRGMLDTQTRCGFEAMNRALKARAEAR